MCHKKVLIALIVLAYTLQTLPAYASVTVDSNIYFGLPAYQTYIHFAREQTLSEVYRENDFWFFNDLGFQSQHANMTILLIESETTEFIVSGTGTCETKIDTGNRGQPIKVEGAEQNWIYDASEDVITLWTVHASDVHVKVKWVTGASGYFLLKVHLTEGGQPLRDTKVSVYPLESIEMETHNLTTGLNGLVEFELPYGTYLVKATHDEKVQTLRVWLTGNKDVGLDFGTPPVEQRGDVVVIFVILAVVLVYLVFMRRR